MGLSLVFALSLPVFITFATVGAMRVLLAGFMFGKLAAWMQFRTLVMQAGSSSAMARRETQVASARLFSRSSGLTAYPGLLAASAWWALLLPVPAFAANAVASRTSNRLEIHRRGFVPATPLDSWIRPVGLA